jgi:sulfofructose kinase
MSDFEVLGIGRPYADLLLVIPHMPQVDDVLIVEQVGHQGGGVVPTAMVTVARLGHTAAIWACISDDYYGDFIAADFRAYGVNADHLQVFPGYHSPLATVLVDRSTQTRSIMSYRGSLPPPTADHFDENLVRDCRVLHLSGSYMEVELKAARAAKSLGVTVSFDGGAGLASPDKLELLRLCDVVVVARRFAQEVAGQQDLPECARALLALGAHTVVITDGLAGSHGWMANGQSCFQPAFQVPVADTTGAGDVYHGAFVVGLLEGWPLAQNMAFASATAALKCTRLGGRAGIPSRPEVQQFLAAHGYLV